MKKESLNIDQQQQSKLNPSRYKKRPSIIKEKVKSKSIMFAEDSLKVKSY